MAKTALVVNLRIDGARETLAALRKLPKDANDELRDASKRLAELMAGRARAAARADSRQAALMAATVRAARDRVPVVQVGGTRRVGRNRVSAFKMLFGSEFGSNRLKQFRPHRGRKGYWFFPLVESQQALISKQWNRAADAVLVKFSKGAAKSRAA